MIPTLLSHQCVFLMLSKKIVQIELYLCMSANNVSYSSMHSESMTLTGAPYPAQQSQIKILNNFMKTFDLIFFVQFEFWRSDNYKCLFADFEKWPFFKSWCTFHFFHLEGSKIRPLFFDMLCFGGFIIDCNFFQTCTFAEFGIIKILGLRSQDIVLNHKIRNVEN